MNNSNNQDSKADFSGFVVSYIEGLKERTRAEKKGVNYGLDWLIYQLGLAQSWEPFRLPFFRTEGVPKSKTEGEFGIDIAFLRKGGGELVIFVLKDERLTNSTWVKQQFYDDIVKASSPNLNAPELDNVENVVIVLAYNKDEDSNGKQLYDNYVANAPKELSSGVTLTFERWNLTKIAASVGQKLLSPSLLPAGLSGHFSYIASQFEDFQFGNEFWCKQLVPGWERFLNEVISNRGINIEAIRIISVSLTILSHKKGISRGSEFGWLDLAEEASMKLWAAFEDAPEKVQVEIFKFWQELYVVELGRIYLNNFSFLTSAHSMSIGSRFGIGVDPINAAYKAYWHLGRLGVLWMSFFMTKSLAEEQDKEGLERSMDRISTQVLRFVMSEPAALRPLIDTHHVQLVLVWLMLGNIDQSSIVEDWLKSILNRLFIRRIGQCEIPFINGANDLATVGECAAVGDGEGLTTNSSYLVLVMLELACSLPLERAANLASSIYQQLVYGLGPDGEPFPRAQTDLVSWTPPEEFVALLLSGSAVGGIGRTVDTLGDPTSGGEEIIRAIKKRISIEREKYPFSLKNTGIPYEVVCLACMRNNQPLPPEYWRTFIFQDESEQES
ncbi:MAG: hypothetical protein P1V20_09515 [Verrucomicrobiales bacterium]|nr:hypothetical protein [Verrucomicrobiales bacterium]